MFRQLSQAQVNSSPSLDRFRSVSVSSGHISLVIDGGVVGCAAYNMPRLDLLAMAPAPRPHETRLRDPSEFLDGTLRLLTVRFADGVDVPMLSPNTPDPFAFRLGRAPDPVPG